MVGKPGLELGHLSANDSNQGLKDQASSYRITIANAEWRDERLSPEQALD